MTAAGSLAVNASWPSIDLDVSAFLSLWRWQSILRRRSTEAQRPLGPVRMARIAESEDSEIGDVLPVRNLALASHQEFPSAAVMTR